MEEVRYLIASNRSISSECSTIYFHDKSPPHRSLIDAVPGSAGEAGTCSILMIPCKRANCFIDEIAEALVEFQAAPAIPRFRRSSNT